jgi:hypothetical protein
MTFDPRLGLLSSTRLHIAATAYSVCCLSLGAVVGLASLEPTPAQAVIAGDLAQRVERIERALRLASLPPAPLPDEAASRADQGAVAMMRPVPRPALGARDAAPSATFPHDQAPDRRQGGYTEPLYGDRNGLGHRRGNIMPALTIAGGQPRNRSAPGDQPVDPSSGRPELLTARELDATVAGQAAASGAAAGRQASSTDAEDEPDPELNALNRVLVEAGGLLLRPWAVEIQPASTFSYRGASALLITEDNGRRVALAQDVKSSTFENSITGRIGLPADFQAEVRVPQRTQREKISSGTETSSRSDSGLGDIEVAASHQFVRETPDLPDVIGEVRYTAPTGDDAFGSNGGLPMGTGFHALSGSVTAVKSFDPVVFLAKAGYTETFEDQKQGFNVDPGNTYSFASGTVLAAGPGVSLRTILALDFTEETSVDGQMIDGSDSVEGVLQLGAAAAISDKTLLDFGVNVGVTDDAPDIGLRIATAYRF